ncbi:hypothetical protein [Wohlfahrtiimonas populi]|uniref:hypothetical protein n=1 Tax=Wohlfahrtiimonas populi TaxID=1940240 RepID=UPI00098D5BF2|nr:hypothetical protein [Wohlfahrtiimonas populi]
MLYKDMPEKTIDDTNMSWGDYLDQEQNASRKKINVIFLGILIIFIFVILGWVRLYPLNRETRYLMIINDPNYGSYLTIEGSKHSIDLSEQHSVVPSK